MASVLTYTATLPWYLVRVIIKSDTGTLNSTVSNTLHIESVSPVDESADLTGGDAKLKALSFTANNVDNVFSSHIFTSSTAFVSVSLDVSYDAGTSWENLFFGCVDLEQLSYQEFDATETRNWSYSVQCISLVARLDKFEAFLAALPASYTGSLTDSRGTIPAYSTDPKGAPNELAKYIAHPVATFWPVRAVFLRILDIMNIGGLITGLSPTFALDTTEIESQAYNDTLSTGYGFSDWYFWGPTYTDVILRFDMNSFGGGAAGSAGIGDAGNIRELLKRMCQTIAAVPIETYNATTNTYTMKLVHRTPNAPVAITGPLGTLLTRSYRNGTWISGGVVTTQELPIVSASGQTGKKSYNARCMFTTSPIWSGGPDYYTWDATGQGVYREGSDGAFTQCKGSVNQLFVKTAANTLRIATKARISPAQSYFGATTGYYGLQEALFDYLIGTGSHLSGYRQGYELTYLGIKGATIADIAPLKKMTIGASDYLIESVSRDVMSNTLKLSVTKL